MFASIENASKKFGIALQDLEFQMMDGRLKGYVFCVDENRVLEVPTEVVQNAIAQKPNPVDAEFIFPDNEVFCDSERQPSLYHSQLLVSGVDPALKAIASPEFNYGYEIGGRSIKFKGQSVLFSEAQAMIFAHLWEHVVRRGAAAVKEEEVFQGIDRFTGSPRINDIFRNHSAIELGLIARIGPRQWTIQLN